MRCLACHGPKRDDESGPTFLSDLFDRLGKGAPAKMRLDPRNRDERRDATVQGQLIGIVLGPAERPGAAAVERDDGTLLGEVKEHLGVDRRDLHSGARSLG